MYTTDMNEGIHAETVTMLGANGDRINAFLARPLGDGKFPAMVLAHHMPGWDLLYREFAYKFAHHGYVTISPNLYFRAGHGTPEDVAAKVRAEGGVSDESAVGDLAGAAKYLNTLPYVNGRIGSSARVPADVMRISRRAGGRNSTPPLTAGADGS